MGKISYDLLQNFLFANRKIIIEKYPVFTDIKTNSKKNLIIISTIFIRTHISIFDDQWNSYDTFHITTGVEDSNKCSYYLQYNNVSRKVEKIKNFMYEQQEYGPKSSTRPKCKNRCATKIIKISLEYLFKDIIKNSQNFKLKLKKNDHKI